MGNKRPADLDRALGVRIREIRLHCDMSQQSLAVALGLTFQQIQKYESGTNRVSFDRLVKMADAFQMTVPDLIEPLAPGRTGFGRPYNAKELAKKRKPYLEGRVSA